MTCKFKKNSLLIILFLIIAVRAPASLTVPENSSVLDIPDLTFDDGDDEEELNDLNTLGALGDNTTEAPAVEENKQENKIDDLDALKDDIGEVYFQRDEDKNIAKELLATPAPTVSKPVEKSVEINIPPKSEVPNFVEKKEEIPEEQTIAIDENNIFQVGEVEQKLLEAAKIIGPKMTEAQWKQVTAPTKIERYKVVKNDWLFKISKRLFGTGFYYPKIWAINPYITNPHEIEPGMILLFNTGDADSMPTLALGTFEGLDIPENSTMSEFQKYGEDSMPAWLTERKNLMAEGNYFQFSTDYTLDDLLKKGTKAFNTEYRAYNPPYIPIIVDDPSKDRKWTFDRSHKVNVKFKEGYSLNTFITTNIVQDFGFIESASEPSQFKSGFAKVFVRFNKDATVSQDEMFSIYHAQGSISAPFSDRKGYQYTIVGHIRAVKMLKENLWECEVTGANDLVNRADRVTVYTPKIERITKTFNSRVVEAAILKGYKNQQEGFSYGDIVYIDRGRADGLEMGNILNVYASHDQGTEKNIIREPAYKIGEMTVITLTDNFATGLVSNSNTPFQIGSISITKSKEDAAKDTRIKRHITWTDEKTLDQKAVKDLDVALNLDNVDKSILSTAAKIKLTDDEKRELERLERKKNFLSDEHYQDVATLEKIEKEIALAEDTLLERQQDDDKKLEELSLGSVEKEFADKVQSQEFDNINEIEKNYGRKYVDGNLNEKDNPYGLTPQDIERIDEMLDPINKKPPQG
ncbi:MAG: LysM peptidoglycan-binding domain-containing protein [Bacteriovoracaceae bacterium]|nr:LysM peptidoglycan-binding domain-containing protein [Bacteriovoracaceae bacterium]